MTSLRNLSAVARAAVRDSVDSTSIFLRDVGRGMLDVSHNSLALLGLLVAAALVFTAGRDDLRLGAESEVLGWLQARQIARVEPVEVPGSTFVEPGEPAAVTRATAIHRKELNRQQATLTDWLARRYRVAPEPVGRLVHEAWQVGQRVGLDPTLILAIIAIESSFNPFAQSPVGAQGLMQVMTKVHNDKYEAFGGVHAAFDPVTNLRVGVQVLKECIQRAGSLEAGLRYYVGAANLPDDGGYSVKVLAMQGFLREVVRGKSLSPHAATVAAGQSAPAAQSSTPALLPLPLPMSSTAPAVRVATLD